MTKVIAVCGTCGAAAVLLGTVNIWLGVICLPILYGIAESLLE